MKGYQRVGTRVQHVVVSKYPQRENVYPQPHRPRLLALVQNQGIVLFRHFLYERLRVLCPQLLLDDLVAAAAR